MGTAEQGSESILTVLLGEPAGTRYEIDSDLARFIAKLRPEVRVPELGPCLTWTAAKRDKAYGNFKAKGRAHRAHKWIFEHIKALVPDQMTLDHVCRNTLCCNPHHAEVVTRVENVRREHVALRELRRGAVAA